MLTIAGTGLRHAVCKPWLGARAKTFCRRSRFSLCRVRIRSTVSKSKYRNTLTGRAGLDERESSRCRVIALPVAVAQPPHLGSRGPSHLRIHESELTFFLDLIESHMLYLKGRARICFRLLSCVNFPSHALTAFSTTCSTSLHYFRPHWGRAGPQVQLPSLCASTNYLS